MLTQIIIILFSIIIFIIIVIVTKIGINIYVSILKFFKYYNINLSILSKCHVLILFYFFLIFWDICIQIRRLVTFKRKNYIFTSIKIMIIIMILIVEMYFYIYFGILSYDLYF